MLPILHSRKNRKNSRTLRLTALLLMVSLICLGASAWAAPADRANPAEQASEQVSEFTETLRALFIHNYKSLWQKQGLGAQLTEIIEKSVDEQYGGLLDRYKALKENAIEPVQKSIVDKFNPLYDEFLSQLQDRFNEDFVRQLKMYFKTSVAEIIIRVDDPKSRAVIMDRSKVLLADNGVELKKRVLGGPTSDAKESEEDSVTVSKWAYLTPLALGTAKLGYDIWNAPEKMKASLESAYSTFFYEEAPEKLWLAIEEFVRNGFREVDSELQILRLEAEEFPASEAGKYIEKKSQAEK